jgi:hypothetical protein
MNSEDRQQLELGLPSDGKPREPHIEAVTPELIRIIKRKPTFLSAWNFAQDFAELEDKEVYEPLQIDSSHWTKIGKGSASPPGDARFVQYFDVVQNEIPLIWLAEKRGYDWMTIRKHRTNEQKVIAEQAQEIRDLRKALSLVVEARR